MDRAVRLEFVRYWAFRSWSQYITGAKKFFWEKISCCPLFPLLFLFLLGSPPYPCAVQRARPPAQLCSARAHARPVPSRKCNDHAKVGVPYGTGVPIGTVCQD